MPAFLAPPVEAGTGRPRPPPSFSVVISAYQMADYVGDAVTSALEQTVPPHEVIVVDDGSTDDIEGALEPFGTGIRFLRQANAGESSAKNAGARTASGEFIAILDADDIFLPRRLEQLADLAAARPDLDILTTDALLEMDGRAVRRCYEGGFTFEVENQRRGILERNFIFGLMAIRRDRMLAMGGFDESIRYGEDWDLCLRLILDGSRAGLVPEVLARYRLRPGSLTSQRIALMRGRLQVLDKATAVEGLTTEEHLTLDQSRARRRRELALMEARAAVLEGRPDARQRSLAVAFGHGQDLPSRIKALGAAIAPRLAGRRLADREAGTRETTAGLRVPRE